MANTTSQTHKRNEITPTAILTVWFNEIQTFRDLEARIASLQTEQLRGAVFERFAEAYLSSMAGSAAQSVWRADAVPESVRVRFNGALDRDRGIDGVFNTSTGEVHAYQVKFRMQRPRLSWTQLSTFVGLTEEFAGPLVFTNCDTVASTVARRRGLYSVTGCDLDRLTAGDFQRIQQWLKGQAPSFTPVHPLPHQKSALEDICTELQTRDRATAVLACGTGKTLIACWTAQRLRAQRVLVLAPSLALVRQTLHEWARALPRESFAWQCVCSDATVSGGTDSWGLRQEDLDFPVTTDPREVRQFLNSDFAGTKVIFSTYHSAPAVAQGMDMEQPFDLCVFDEAHRTAGRQGLKFSFALDDNNLPIRKRLFMTATPKHYDLCKRTQGGDLASVYSMDDTTTYGKVAHSLGVAGAAERGIICPYKVVISVVTDAEIKVEQLRHAEVVMDGEAVNAAEVAKRLALAHAVKRFGIQKLFTFHRSIKSARMFASDTPRGIGQSLPAFAAAHINGAMRMSMRHRLLTEFSEAPQALMSNARCLTEGVDVPDVDMVAFLTPKRSRIDIIQAIGRALRKPNGKKCGYVFVPIHLQQGESVEAAVRRTDFEHVWEILQALQEQDTVMAECIRQMTEDLAKGKALHGDGFAGRVEVLGPEVSLGTLKTAIAVECVRNLGGRWDERYGQLKAFHETHGHCLPVHRRDGRSELAAWVTVQRIHQRNGTLRPERERKLADLDFEWDPIAAAWESKFNELNVYKEKHGHCDVPQGWPRNPSLGAWVAAQRRFHGRGRLDPDRIKQLESLGFVWDMAEVVWRVRVQELRNFSKKHGHCDVPQKCDDYPGLGSWVNGQRQLKRKGKLSAERIKVLEQIGLRWSPGDDEWERRYAELEAFQRKNGHCLVPADCHEHKGLRAWVVTLRGQKRRGQLTEDRIRRLGALGFVWNARAVRWSCRVSELEAFAKTHGHAEVPQDYSANKALATWVVKQRQVKRRGKLSAERIKQLESFGFEWQPHNQTWDERYKELLGLRKQGQPWNPPKNKQLAKWLKHQRCFLKAGSLRAERARRLRRLLAHDAK